MLVIIRDGQANFFSKSQITNSWAKSAISNLKISYVSASLQITIKSTNFYD
jgi:hypothetical protein